MARKYRCPHCRSVQLAEPDPTHAKSIACERCAKRFRIPKARGPARRKTSMSQVSVREQLARQADAMRSQSDKEKIDRIVKERRFGDYDILDELGRGGMGVVYKAFHRALKRMVALKIVLPDAADQETMLKRFRREAELHARLSHPNIVSVYDSGVIDGIHYFAMDFVTGTQLTKLMGSPEFTLERRVHIVQQIADALEHAHGHGVVHRDIKPDNIIVDQGWNANLVDFGIAKPTDTSGMESITRQGLAVGTPHYMAPEQFRPKLGKIGRRSDVYSLGAVGYHLLSGHPPFEADSAHQVLIKAATQDAPPLNGQRSPSDEAVPDDLISIIMQCLSKQPEARYQTARALAQDLLAYQAGDEVSSFPLSGGEKLRRKLRKNRGRVGIFAALASVLLVLVVLSLSSFISQRSTRTTAQDTLDDARSEVKRARGAIGDDEATELRLDKLKRAIEDTDTELDTGTVALIMTILSAVVGLVGIIIFGIVLVIAPLTRTPPPAAPTVEAAPDEIGATAYEV